MDKVTINRISSSIGENYSDKDLNLISSFDSIGNFSPEKNNIEFSIYNEENNLEYIEYNHIDYTTTFDYNSNKNLISSINLTPEKDIIEQGYDQGNYTAVYNFVQNQLSSSLDSPLYIKNISSDRTELRVASNTISNNELEILVAEFKEILNSSRYFEDFYLNFGNNNLYLANNILLDTISDPSQYLILIKLYEPLDLQFGVKDTFWVNTKTAEEVSYIVEFRDKIIPPPLSSPLKGPNFSLNNKGKTNNSTTYLNKTQLEDIFVNPLNSSFPTASFTTYNELQNLLQQKGITINIDYLNWNNFIYFSSAEERVRNFYYKIGLIEQYDNEIQNIGSLLITDASSSLTILQDKKRKIIESFDGYESLQYFSSGSYRIFPKANNTKPYILVSTGSTAALAWYQQEIESGSSYDSENVDRLVNNLPQYIQNDNRNSSFFLFLDMVGQHFDQMWTYTKDISNRFDSDNRLNYGMSKDVVADAIRSMGVNLYQNNFSDDDLKAAFIGLVQGSNPIPNDGEELITRYLTTDYEFAGYAERDTLYYQNQVLQIDYESGDINPPYIRIISDTYTTPDFPNNGINFVTDLLTDKNTSWVVFASSSFAPRDSVNKEFYKRIFHNLPYILKKKGTVGGVRTLINSFGIPDTILRISEFGGKDKHNIQDWDYYQNKFNYTATFTNGGDALQRVTIPWGVNSKWGSKDDVPETIMFRFKPVEGIPNEDKYSIVLDFDDTFGNTAYLTLEYSGSAYTSASYSGSIPSSSNQYGVLTYFDGANNPVMRCAAPFYDNNWWSVYLNKSESVYDLRVANKIYESHEGFTIGYYTSSTGEGTNNYWTGVDDLRLPYRGNSGAIIDGSNTFYKLTGSYQEIRYYNTPLSESTFQDFAMNPYSLEGVNYSSSADNLIFRAPLGTELSVLTGSVSSSHPKITGSEAYITSSFPLGESLYTIGNTVTFPTNKEFIYHDQPAVGIKNRVSEKVRSQNISVPSGDTLSSLRKIQQNYFVPESGSYTRDINSVEIAFSPQNEINDDINASFGYFNIGEYIGDPRQVSESATSYSNLDKLRDNYFNKYYKNYDWKDYVRLIKYFDNSLFKMIKDFVPAKSNLATGIVIKQHLLERNKHKPAQVEISQHDYSASIASGFIEGGTGGSLTGLDNSFISTGSFTLQAIRLTTTEQIGTWINALENPGLTPTEESLFEYLPVVPGSQNSIIYNNPNRLTNRVTYRVSGSTALGGNRKVDIQIFSVDRKTPIAHIYDFDPTSTTETSKAVTFDIFPSESIKIRIRPSASVTNTVYTHEFIADPDYVANPITVSSVSGSVKYYKVTEDEYYNGEFSGSEYTVTKGTLNASETVETLVTDNRLISTEESLGAIFTYQDPDPPSTRQNGIFILTDETQYSPPPAGSSPGVGNNDRGVNRVLMFYRPSVFEGVTEILISETSNKTGANENMSSSLDLLSSGDILPIRFNDFTNPAQGTIPYTFYFNIANITKVPLTVGSYYIIQVGNPVEAMANQYIFMGNGTHYNNISGLTNTEANIIIDPASLLQSTINVFGNNDPLLNNVNQGRPSSIYMDVDYSQNIVLPINQNALEEGQAQKAIIPDSNYSTSPWSRSRYKGSKMSSLDINVTYKKI